MQILPLTKDNVAYAVGLAAELHKAGTFGLNGPPFNWSYCMARMELCIDDVNYYFRMARDDTGYVGAVCGSVAPFFFSPSLMGVEDAWYVREGTPNRAAIAMRLMRGFVDWCLDDKGAVLVQTGDIASIDTLAVDTLYRRMGFTRFGTVYKFVRTT